MTSDHIHLAALTGVEAILLLISFRRSGLLLLPNGALLLIIYYQIIYLLVREGYVDNPVLTTYALGGLQARFWDAEYFYAGVFALLFVSSWGIRAPARIAAVNAALNALNKERLAAVNRIGSILVLSYMAIYALSVKWSVIWSNEIYLAMVDPAQVAVGGPISNIAVSLLVPTGVACACLSAINFSRSNHRQSVLFASVWIFVVVLQFGAHQRGATLICGMFLLTYFTLAEKRNWFILATVFGFAMLSYPAALAGRIMPMQGIASISPTIRVLFELGSGDFINLALTNIGEGIFTFGESLMAPVSYPLSYKILSFSPLPSAIDGFAAIREVYQIRLAVVVPLSGYAEALKFGPGYFVLLTMYFVLAIRLNISLQNKNQLVFLLVNTFIFLSFFMLSAYPLRSGLRLLVVAIGIALVFIALDLRGRKTVTS